MKEFFHKKPVRIVAAVLAMAVLAGIVFGCQVLFDPLDNRIAEGVSIGGFDVGGMTRREAKEALSAAAQETVLTEAMPVQLPKDTVPLDPADMIAELRIRDAVRAAFRVGRWEDAVVHELGLLPYLDLNRDAIRGAIQAYADTHDTTLTQPTYRMEGELPDLSTGGKTSHLTCQILYITLGLPTAHLDVEETFFRVLQEYDNAISDCRSGSYGVSMEVPETAQPNAPDLEAIYQEFYIAPVNDSLDMQTYGFVHGSYGYHFDPEAAASAVAGAGYGETVSIAMECVDPEILGDGAYFRDVLGYCNTKHNTNENRNNNLRLLCEALDGMILQPGEDFSYNQAVGERTAERGYKAAPAYSGDRLVDAIGGGVCQGSSTLYNCVLLADLEVTNRLCHGGTVSYLPLGLDATVNWGTTDFCFRNSANFPIMIKAEVSDGYVRMQILGTDEKDYYIKMEARSYEDGDIIYATSYKCKYDKETNELISREKEAHSVYYKSVG